MSAVDENFERIVAYARETNPFYAEWLRGNGRIPILTRRVFLENNDRILNGHPATGASSGSLGIPVRVSISPRRRRLLREIDARCTDWLGGPLVTSHIVATGDQTSPSQLAIGRPVEEQIDWIIKRYEHAGAVALITYPSNAILLAAAVRDRKIDMSFLRRVGVISETFERDDRADLQRAFPNALIWSNYSATEVGMIAGQCPNEPDFHHIMTDVLRVEILDEQNRACPDGEMGRVVITDYFNDWSPLIRYEIGDLAVRESCPCGRIALPAFSAVLGKVRGALMHRGGRRVPFVELLGALRGLPGMKQFQVVQEELERFTVRLVTNERHEEKIAAAFHAHFGYRPNLTFEYRDFLEREPNGKFHRSICRI